MSYKHSFKRCARCLNVALVARNVSGHGRNETATLALYLYDHAAPHGTNYIREIMVQLQFSGNKEF
jgi:hypothetical protein